MNTALIERLSGRHGISCAARWLVFFKDNKEFPDLNEEARRALARMDEILSASSPYGMLHETEDLIAKVDAANQLLLTERRADASRIPDNKIAQIKAALAGVECRRRHQ